MGADLIIGVAVQSHPEREPNELRRRLDTITREQAAAIFENVQGISHEELYDDPECDPRDDVQGWIGKFIDVYEGAYHRNIILMQHPQLDKMIAIGGGDSWGDTPYGYDEVTAVAEWGEW